MSTTITYDNFSFHATDAGTTIYTSDFSADVDGWIEKSLGDLYITHDGKLLLQPLETAAGVHYAKKEDGFTTVGKKYKLTGEGYIKAGAPNVDHIRFYDGVDYLLGDFVGGTKGTWQSFSVEFTARRDYISFYMIGGGGTEFSANLTGDLIYLRNIVVTEITDGFPTPYVSRTQDSLEYGNRWGQGTTYSLDGQITGSNFDDLINKQNILLSGFSRDYKNLDITEGGESIAGFPTKECKINSISFVQLLSPTTSITRMKKIINNSHEMIYYISMLSTTGGKLKVSPKEILKNYGKIKKIIKNRKKNLVIGFGITSKNISSFKSSDGCVVGSEICKKISKSIKNKQNPVTNVSNMVKNLRRKLT